MKGSFSIQASVSAIDEADEDEAVESWTAPYIFGQDGGQAKSMQSRLEESFEREEMKEDGVVEVPAHRSETLARARGDASDVAHAHPKPLRQGQGTKFESGFATGGPLDVQSHQYVYQGGPDEDEGRRPLNFGGAFVPPSKAQSGNFRRPVPSTLRSSTLRPASLRYHHLAPVKWELVKHMVQVFDRPHPLSSR